MQSKQILAAVFETQSPESQHGAILALGYMVGRYMSRRRGLTMLERKGATSNDDEELITLATKTVGKATDNQEAGALGHTDLVKQIYFK